MKKLFASIQKKRLYGRHGTAQSIKGDNTSMELFIEKRKVVLDVYERYKYKIPNQSRYMMSDGELRVRSKIERYRYPD